MPDRPDGTANRAAAGQSARRRVLGEQLRAYYDSVTGEPVPDALTELMAQLARQAGQDGGKPPSGGGTSGQDG